MPERKQKTKLWYVYIIVCDDGTFYTGISTDVRKRFQQHKSGKGAKYTQMRGAKKIMFTEEHADRSSATIREMQIKKLPRKEKVKLINSYYPPL